jgi:L-aspartate oxidase
MTKTQHTDFLVIGSGIAGLSYALKMAAHGEVTIITKKHSAESNTNYAQGGIAAVMNPLDSFEQHIEDTLIAGGGICDPRIVKQVVEEAPNCVKELIALGTRFTISETEHPTEQGDARSGRGSEAMGGQAPLHLELEGGHSAHRIVHAADVTGREIERSLLTQVQSHPHINVREYHYCLDLIISRKECIGVWVVDERDGTIEAVYARSTLLASGGSGQIYEHTTNPAIATGDGVAMAYRAGAKIANMEFFQFHPTSLFHPEAKSFLISEAVRGAGGLLFNQSGERFMLAYHPSAELAPRDVVARAIDDQLKQRGEEFVLLDISHKPEAYIEKHFPTIRETCKSYGIDIVTQAIPIVPAAHYQCGGVMTNNRAETSIARLLACGEVAYTGLHGANRLASNSLLEAMVFSRHAATSSLALSPLEAKAYPKASPFPPAKLTSHLGRIEKYRHKLRALMWQKVGIVRSNKRLAEALDELEALKQKITPLYQANPSGVAINELRNLLAVAMLITRSSMRRQESRGLHYLVDQPQPRAIFAKPTVL